MAEKDVYAFLERYKNDAGFREEVMRLGEKVRLAEEGKKSDAMLEFVAREGFTFTAEEFAAAAKKECEQAKSQSQELSDEFLANVSEGVLFGCGFCPGKWILGCPGGLPWGDCYYF
ncbi:MAG: Nif11 family protein [Bacillota bacterium]